MVDFTQHSTIKKIFHRAIDLAGDELETYLHEACGDDSDLLDEVRRLLESAKATPDSFMEPPAGAVITAGQTLGHYSIEESLGRGGMGEVYRARDSQLDRSVALKVLPASFAKDPERLSRFEREAKALAALNHPNIVTVFSVEAAAEVPYLTMELVEGEPLGRCIPRGGLSLERFFELAVPMADALAVAHEKGIIHRDLKPGNIMVERGGQPKILDFGLAKTVPASTGPEAETVAATATLETGTGVILGTVGYMSPEQVRGEVVDPRSDVFALGLILYEMATGARAFMADTSPDILSAILRDTPTPVEQIRPELPNHLNRVIRHCLEKDPERRYQSAKDVRNELEDLGRELETQSILEGRPTEPAPVDQGRGAHTKLVIGAVIALIAALGIAYLLVRRGVEGPPAEAGPQIRSLAVLPFDNLMNDPEQQYFVEGMHEALITDLAKIGALRVISRTSAVRYATTEKSLPEIARELNVDALIEGSVLRAEGQVRITAQLIDGETDQHLWAQSYDRDLENILSLLSEVAQAIAGEIKVAVTAEQQERLESAPSVDPVAQELFLKGQYHFNRGVFREFGVALDYHRQAVEVDPSFAAGWSALAGSYLIHGFFKLAPPEEMIPKALAAAYRALELDASQGGAHVTVGYVALFFDWDWATAKHELELSLELDPTNTMNYHAYADYLFVIGDCEGSVEQVRRGRQYDPMGGWANTFVVGHLTLCGRYEEALEEGRRALDNGIEGTPLGHYMGLALWLEGKHEEALAQWRVHYGPESEYLKVFERGFSQGGPQGAMLAWAERELGREPPRRNPYALAALYAAAGETEAAFVWLEQAYSDHTPQLLHLTVDPRLDSLRNDPRFDELLKRIGIPQ